MKIAGPLAAALLLAGCADHSRAPEAAAPEPEPHPAGAAMDVRPVIACFGDSLTEGFGVDPERSYPAVLQRLLDKRRLKYRVVNAGLSGETSTDGLARVDTVIALKPKIVVLEFGANDGLRGVPVAVMRSNLSQMIERLQAANIRILLAGMKLPPNYGPEYTQAFEKLYPEMAARYQLRRIDFFLEGVAGTANLMQRDGLHPTAEGYARVAQLTLEALLPMLP